MTREKHSPLTIDATTGALDPPPPAIAKIKLNSLGDVRREMATIYREARAGKLDISDAGRFAYVLTGIGKLIEVEVIESRIAALETLQEQRKLK